VGHKATRVLSACLRCTAPRRYRG